MTSRTATSCTAGWPRTGHTPKAPLIPTPSRCSAACTATSRLAIVANQEAATVDALTRDGFGPYVDVWGISAVVGHEKPSRAFFEWALRECGSTPEHTVHIGNRLDTDVRPAQALGIGTIWVLRGEAPPEPTPEQLAEADLAVPDLTTVADVILERAAS